MSDFKVQMISAVETYSAPPSHLTVFKGPTSRGKGEGKTEGREKDGEREGEGPGRQIFRPRTASVIASTLFRAKLAREPALISASARVERSSLGLNASMLSQISELVLAQTVPACTLPASSVVLTSIFSEF